MKELLSSRRWCLCRIREILGVSKLGKVLSQRMAKQGESGLILDYGSIEGDYSLKTNTFPIPIPKGDYTVCRCAGGLSFENRWGSA